MTYSGAPKAKEARESLGKALAALQEDPNIPPEVLAVAQNIAQAVGALFEAERASSEPDGKSSVKSALGSLSQTLALLQDVRAEHAGIDTATQTLAKAMSLLFPLTTVPNRMPPPDTSAPRSEAPNPFAKPAQKEPAAPSAFTQPASTQPSTSPERPAASQRSAAARPAAAPVAAGDREHVEANLGATTESNFYVGFSGEISQGGVFISTYNILAKGTPVRVLVTLPGNLSTEIDGHVRFVRDPMDMMAESEPGMGVAFDGLPKDSRELILRFIRKRPPMFYDE